MGQRLETTAVQGLFTIMQLFITDLESGRIGGGRKYEKEKSENV